MRASPYAFTARAKDVVPEIELHGNDPRVAAELMRLGRDHAGERLGVVFRKGCNGNQRCRDAIDHGAVLLRDLKRGGICGEGGTGLLSIFSVDRSMRMRMLIIN